MSRFVELHLIQNFAPSCLNRDDTNTPKDCEFGGFRRARISSQCLKRSIRQSSVFAEALGRGLGARTKLLISRLTAKLSDADKKEEEVGKVVAAFVESWLSALDGDKTKVLLYLGDDEMERMKELLLSRWDDLTRAVSQSASEAEEGKKGKKKKADSPVAELCQELKKSYTPGTRAADIALFGRMMAEHPDMNIDAASQVAHAVSTHKVSMEMDFYTAVDDLQPQEETGAGMMGVTGFNSSCFYRYALIDVEQLKENLGQDAALAEKTIEAFLKGAVAAIPTGKQNSMAAHNPPDTILAVVRDSGAPVSLANAFEKPAAPQKGKGLIEVSTEKLDAYWDKLTKIYGQKGVAARPVCTTCPDSLNVLADRQVGGFDEVVAVVLDRIGLNKEAAT